jgi:hypothetical protein
MTLLAHGGKIAADVTKGRRSLYWLLSTSILKNEERTAFFAWARLQLSEGLCVHS